MADVSTPGTITIPNTRLVLGVLALVAGFVWGVWALWNWHVHEVKRATHIGICVGSSRGELDTIAKLHGAELDVALQALGERCIREHSND